MNLRTPALLSAVAAAATLTLAAPGARATGMQGHVYMAMCAAEQVSDPRLRAIFDAYPTHLANGAFLVDSGYATDDYDQGEIPHWEGFIEAYLQQIRAKYPAPYDGPDAAPHVAVLMGMAAHGITDSTFDTLIYARAEQVEPSGMESFDTAMDVFIVADMPRYYIPEIVADPAALSETFTTVGHPVSEKDVKSAISAARSGIAAVSELLYKAADDYGAKYPWGRAHFLDTRTPGSYAFGARVVMGYYRELLRRLDGDTSADEIVIGTYPSADFPLVTLDPARPDGKILLFFGEGLDRATIGPETVTVLGPGGAVVPSKADVFRGDQWANVLVVQAEEALQPATAYEVVLASTVQTLSGASPSGDLVFSFTTCADPGPNGDCPPPDGPAPESACPITEEMYESRPGEGGGGAGGEAGSGGGGQATSTGTTSGGPAANDASGGCALGDESGDWTWALGVLGLTAALVRRRRR